MIRYFRLILTLFVALLNMSAFARILTPDEALQNFTSDNPSCVRKTAGVSTNLRLINTIPGKNTNHPAIYVYSSGEEGFILLSASDLTPCLLGYCDKGKIDSINPNLKYWIDQYINRIETAEANGISAEPQEVDATRISIDPLLTCEWGQNEPYNLQCPVVGDKRAVTGCVATALAQVMYYHRWPQGYGKGENSYSWVYGDERFTESMDFSAVQFDWDGMSDRYSDESAEESRQAVAELMHSVGVSANMLYSPEGSSSFPRDGATAMSKNWGYSESANLFSRDMFSDEEWDAMLYKELYEGRPVVYTGQSSTVRHAFLCDGYDAQQGLYHFNWGWNGNGNGYFRLTALNPGQYEDGGFDSSQSALINLHPENSEYVEPELWLVSGITVANPIIYRRQGISIAAQLKNCGLPEFSGSYAICIVNRSKPENPMYYGYSNTVLQCGSSVSLTNIVSNLTEGIYDAYIVYKKDNETEWRLPKVSNSADNHLYIEVKGCFIIFEENMQCPLPEYTATLTDIVPIEERDNDDEGNLHIYPYHTYRFVYDIDRHEAAIEPSNLSFNLEIVDSNGHYYATQQYHVGQSDRFPLQCAFDITPPEDVIGINSLCLTYSNNNVSKISALDNRPIEIEVNRTAAYTSTLSKIVPENNDDIDEDGNVHIYSDHKYQFIYTVDRNESVPISENSNLYFAINSDGYFLSKGPQSIPLSATEEYPREYKFDAEICHLPMPGAAPSFDQETYQSYPKSSSCFTAILRLETPNKTEIIGYDILDVDENLFTLNFTSGIEVYGTFGGDGDYMNDPYRFYCDYGAIDLLFSDANRNITANGYLCIWRYDGNQIEDVVNTMIDIPLKTDKTTILRTRVVPCTQELPLPPDSDSYILEEHDIGLDSNHLEYNKLYQYQLYVDGVNRYIGTFFMITDISAGVPNVEYINPSDIHYYDLFGREVKNPEAGIYIRRIGNRAEKILVH